MDRQRALELAEECEVNAARLLAAANQIRRLVARQDRTVANQELIGPYFIEEDTKDGTQPEA